VQGTESERHDPVIAVNGKAFATTEPGGAVRVALKLVEHIALSTPGWRVEVHVPAAGEAIPDWRFPGNVRVFSYRGRLYRHTAGRQLWEQLALPHILRTCRSDVLLNLTNSLPVYRRVAAPQILLVHDAGFLNTAWFKRSYSHHVCGMIRRAIAIGVHFVTVSQASAHDLRSSFPGLTDITVVPNGLDVMPDTGIRPPVPRPYILYLGSINPRKNLVGALSGFRKFRAQRGDAYHLAVAGAYKPMFRKGEARDRTDDNAVTYLGYVGEDLKWSLLRHASALLLPSHLEGFGLPVLEALAVGTPAVVSRIPVFEELFRDTAVLVDPMSADDIARGLAEATMHGPRRAPDSVTDHFRRTYDWSVVARQYITLIQRCLNTS